MTDIVDDLKRYAEMSNYPGTMLDAADEITTLRAEVERLRAALDQISQFSSNPVGSGPAYTQCGKMVRIARAALGEEKTG